MTEQSLGNALEELQITYKITEYRINKLMQMIEAIEKTLTNNGEGYLKELLDAIEEACEEIQSLKVREGEIAKLQEENRKTIGKLYSSVDDNYKSLIYSFYDRY